MGTRGAVSRRANVDQRCARCRMLRTLCVCRFIVTQETRTRLLLLLHAFEARKPTNTGLLAATCLANSEVVVRGIKDAPNDVIALPETHQPVLLFPAEDAMPLAEAAPELKADGRPVLLIVPDGNWRQAFKMRARVPGLSAVRCVTLPASEPSVYRLRSEAHEHGLATIEAIARAMAVLEGPAVADALLAPFRAMVERTLWARGNVEASEVESGIPEEAFVPGPPRKSAG